VVPAKLQIQLRLSDAGLTNDQQTRHPAVARMVKQKLHLIEDRGRTRVSDPPLGPDVGDPFSLAGPGEPAALFVALNLVAGHR
jgi:hypothetical protein